MTALVTFVRSSAASWTPLAGRQSVEAVAEAPMSRLVNLQTAVSA